MMVKREHGFWIFSGFTALCLHAAFILSLMSAQPSATLDHQTTEFFFDNLQINKLAPHGLKSLPNSVHATKAEASHLRKTRSKQVEQLDKTENTKRLTTSEAAKTRKQPSPTSGSHLRGTITRKALSSANGKSLEPAKTKVIQSSEARSTLNSSTNDIKVLGPNHKAKNTTAPSARQLSATSSSSPPLQPTTSTAMSAAQQLTPLQGAKTERMIVTTKPSRRPKIAALPVAGAASSGPAPTATLTSPVNSHARAPLAKGIAPSKAISAAKPTAVSRPAKTRSKSARIAPSATKRTKLANLPAKTTPQEPEADNQEDQVRKAAQTLAQLPTKSCSLITPRRLPSGELGLLGIGNDNRKVREIIQSFRQSNQPVTMAQFAPITNSQCDAISFAQHNNLPANITMGIKLEQTIIQSGSLLKGGIWGGGKEVHLLLVDDEGNVQSMDPLLKPTIAMTAVDGTVSDSGVAFNTPIVLTGKTDAAVQLLVALRSSKTPQTLITQNGSKADRFFAALSQEYKSNNLVLALAFTAFVVKP
nr:hypothetical protein [uncultured Cohaesibacter sp.]